MKQVLSITLLLLATSSFANDMCDAVVESLQWLDNAVASADAEKAMSKGNFKFIAVNGFGRSVPGISKDEHPEAYKSDNYILIVGTSDAVCSREHIRLTIRAFEYARKYNEIVLSERDTS